MLMTNVTNVNKCLMLFLLIHYLLIMCFEKSRNFWNIDNNCIRTDEAILIKSISSLLELLKDDEEFHRTECYHYYHYPCIKGHVQNNFKEVCLVYLRVRMLSLQRQCGMETHCHIVKNTRLQTAFLAILPTG